MGRIKNEEIIGYEIDGRTICCECFNKEYADGYELSESELITVKDREIFDGLLFCDVDGREI